MTPNVRVLRARQLPSRFIPDLRDDLFGPGSEIRVIGHRGAAAFAPENTLPSFQHAIDVEAHGVELDLHCSVDGHLIVIHDPTLSRTTDGTGPVEERTLHELQTFDAGYQFTMDGGKTFPFRGQGIRIPTLEEVFEVVGTRPVVTEIKSVTAGHAMGRWLRTTVIVSKFSWVGSSEKKSSLQANTPVGAVHIKMNCADMYSSGKSAWGASWFLAA